MNRPTTREVRAWAGDKLPPSKGSLPAALIIAWNKAHPDRPYGMDTWGEKHHRTGTSAGGRHG